MRICYFISYWAMGSDARTGYGRIEYNTDRPITGDARLQEIESSLAERNPQYKQVIILNWQRFENEAS